MRSRSSSAFRMTATSCCSARTCARSCAHVSASSDISSDPPPPLRSPGRARTSARLHELGGERVGARGLVGAARGLLARDPPPLGDGLALLRQRRLHLIRQHLALHAPARAALASAPAPARGGRAGSRQQQDSGRAGVRTRAFDRAQGRGVSN